MDYNQKLRYNRIFYENLFLLSMEKDSIKDNKYCFKISGSTANIYNVSFYNYEMGKSKFYCNCPDSKSHAKKTNSICKHTCFVIFKVLKGSVDVNCTEIFDTNCLSEEERIKTITKINNINFLDDSDFINKDFIEKYNKIKNSKKDLFNVSKDEEGFKDDDCPICYDVLKTKELCKQCPICNNIIHIKCIKKWLSLGKDSCPYCRSDIWKKYNENSYENLFD